MNVRENFSQRGKQSLLEKKFISKVLNEEGKEIINSQTKVIAKSGRLFDTGFMSNNRFFNVSGSNNHNGDLRISFPHYLRFHDMKKRNTKQSAFAVFSATKSRSKRKKQYHLYNRIVFGRMNAIISQMQFGFTEEMKNELSGELNIHV